MADTIISQGTFTSAGVAVNLPIYQGVDWIEVWNYTALATAQSGSADLGYYYYWQSGMPSGGGIFGEVLGAATGAPWPASYQQLAAGTGFAPFDSSVNNPLASVAITATTNVASPIVSTGSTTGLVSGSVVRLFNVTGAPDLSGYDFSIDTIVANTSFRLSNILANAPGAAGTGGQYRIIPFDPQFYPTVRYIVNAVSSGVNTVFTTSIPSGYTVGQAIRVIVPSDTFAGTSVYGMTQINNLEGTVVAVNNALHTQSVTLNINSSSFTAFTFPTAAQAVIPLNKAMLVPVGEDTGYALSQMQNILADATVNNAAFGMTLAAGAKSPAGQNNDVIYWKAGKAVSSTTNIQNVYT